VHHHYDRYMVPSAGLNRRMILTSWVVSFAITSVKVSLTIKEH